MYVIDMKISNRGLHKNSYYSKAAYPNDSLPEKLRM